MRCPNLRCRMPCCPRTSLRPSAPASIRRASGKLAATSPSGAPTQSLTTAEFAAARQKLNASIEQAARKEDFAAALNLKRELQALNDNDPVWQLNQQLQACVREERFQEAARLKQQLFELEKSLGPSAPDDASLGPNSDTTTCGVRVRVQSLYRPAESSPQHGQFFFSYHVVITNESTDVVQLRHRHWIIKDSNGKTEEVRGPGVVGVQPILLPGKSFEYDSGCPLRAQSGTMEGEYEMWVWSEAAGEFNRQFEARIGRFRLRKD